jgi:divalent metal cation (Fe/Co/Zn/Cd) transporter
MGVDKIYARKTGFRYHVDLHLEVDPELTVAASHVIGGRVRSGVRERLGWVADVLVHIEPASVLPDVTSAPRSRREESHTVSEDLGGSGNRARATRP